VSVVNWVLHDAHELAVRFSSEVEPFDVCSSSPLPGWAGRPGQLLFSWSGTGQNLALVPISTVPDSR
jgi:hypothetical protein